jgi:hypothetical protein
MEIRFGSAAADRVLTILVIGVIIVLGATGGAVDGE